MDDVITQKKTIGSFLKVMSWAILTLPRLRRSLPLPMGEGRAAIGGEA
jgi:hypothetical protein